MKQLVKSILAILTGQVLLRVLGVLFTPVLVRILTKPEFGVYAATLAIFQISTALSRVGLFGSIVKHTAEYDREQKSAVLVGGLALSVGYALLAALAISFVKLLSIPGIFQHELFFTLLAVAILFRNPFDVFRAALYGQQRESTSEKLKVLRKFLYVVLALVLASSGLAVQGVFFGYAIAYVVSLFLAYYLVSQTFTIRWRKDVRTAKERIRELASYGGINVFGSIAALLLYKTDILLVSYFHGDTLAAEYQAALVPAELIWFIPGAIQAALLQDTAKDWADRRIESINRKLESGIKYAVLSLTLFGIGLFALAEEFLTIYYGPEYTSSALALRILIVGTFFYGVNRVAGPVLQATGRLTYQQATVVMALVLNIILNLLLIPSFGIEGAAVGTAVSYTSVLVGSAMIFRFTEFRMVSLSMAKNLTLLVVSFTIPYLGIVSLVEFRPIVSLLIFPIVGLILFALASSSLDLLTKQDVKQLLEDR